MFSCKTYVKLIAITFLCFFPNVRSQSFPGNSSGFIGEHSRRRQAYYHWRDWLMQHPAVVQKVPPVPKTNNLDAGMDLFVRLSPFVVLEVDDSRQTISMSSKLEFMWTDPSLALTPELVEMFTDGNASSLPFSVSVPRQVLWAPPVIMVEGISDLSVLEAFSEATINQNGSVYVDLPRILTLTCPFNMIDYPFDEHYCPITFFDISITSNIYPLAWDQNFSKQLSINGEWVLVSVSNNTIHIPPERIVYTQYVLHLRRKTAYYTVMILMPMVMTSYLNVLVFLLPPDLGDKASYLVTLTISLSVFTSFFNTDMPRGVDSTPTIFILLIYVYAEGVVVMLLSMAVLVRYHGEQRGQDARQASSAVCDTFSGREDGGKGAGKARKKEKGKLTGKQLDIVFFLLGLSGNTLVLAFMLMLLNGVI